MPVFVVGAVVVVARLSSVTGGRDYLEGPEESPHPHPHPLPRPDQWPLAGLCSPPPRPPTILSPTPADLDPPGRARSHSATGKTLLARIPREIASARPSFDVVLLLGDPSINVVRRKKSRTAKAKDELGKRSCFDGTFFGWKCDFLHGDYLFFFHP